MSDKVFRASGFSLVEVTLALGVAAFCLIAVFGLLPIGVKTNQAAFSQTAASSILSSVVADMRAAGKSAQSPQYQITFGTRKDLCFDSEGGFADCTATAPPPTARYRAVITFPVTTTYATCADVRISWPAVVDPTSSTTTPGGVVETLAAFDQH
jgi:uncharacterized protein (TIGR02598 family)